MDKKMMWKLRWEAVKEYLPSFKKPFASRKGSPTIEYVTILAAGALLAGIVITVFKNDEKGSIRSQIESKIKKAIKGEGDGGDGDNTEKPGDKK